MLFNIKTKLGDAVEGLKQDHKVKHLLRARARARYTLVLHNIRGGLGGRAAWLRRHEIRGPSHLHLAVRVA